MQLSSFKTRKEGADSNDLILEFLQLASAYSYYSYFSNIIIENLEKKFERTENGFLCVNIIEENNHKEYYT